MKTYIFFSVHDELFHRVAEVMRARGITAFSGFAWGKQQEEALRGRGIEYDPLVVFTRDMLPKIDDGQPPDLDWLAQRERDLGVSFQRMLAAERHLLEGRTFTEIMRMAEVVLREIAANYDRIKPDFVLSTDIACFVSYAHFALARERGIPFWCVGSGRMPQRISVYSAGAQRWERYESLVAELGQRGLTSDERRNAEAYLETFRDRPARPSGMKTRDRKPGIALSDLGRLRYAARRFFGDRENPTSIPPTRVIQQRLLRMARVRTADAAGVFEQPVAGEKFVLFPLHYQPEATTLVQAPLYVDQIALLRDIAASLPVGYRLYVKEHVSSRGRRPLSYYQQIRKIPAVRMLGPDVDTFALIRDAAAIAVITGTAGWEGLMFGKPVVSFGHVFYNLHKSVYRAGRAPKDDWYELFQRAITNHTHDRDSTLVLISALQQASHPGFIGNPNSFPEALDPENIAAVANAVLTEVEASSHKTLKTG
jgi:hypothetical protein